MIKRLEHFLTTRHLLIGTGLMRFFLGSGILYHLLFHYRERHLLWGSGGPWPTYKFLEASAERGIITLFQLSDSPWFFECIYHLGILIVLMFTLGFRTRLATVLTFLLFWSLYYRNPFITNGGDNLVRIQLFYMMFTQAGAAFSLDRWLKKRKQGKIRGRLAPYGAVLHNVAAAAIIIQLVFLYFTSGIYKVMGSMWQEGTAVYYAMRVQDYVWPKVSPWFWQSETIIVFLSYASVLFQVSFPFLLLNRFTKYLALLGAFTFHTGVGLMMNLALFSWYMIACEWILLGDREYLSLGPLRKRDSIQRRCLDAEAPIRFFHPSRSDHLLRRLVSLLHPKCQHCPSVGLVSSVEVCLFPGARSAGTLQPRPRPPGTAAPQYRGRKKISRGNRRDSADGDPSPTSVAGPPLFVSLPLAGLRPTGL